MGNNEGMIRLIAAIDRKHGMGKNGGQPWYIPHDERWFTEQTKKHGGIVLVGSTTYQTFGKPLEGRKNYVLKRDPSPLEGSEIVTDLEKFLNDFADKDIWVIGGANVFAQTVERADELYLTHIEADFGCDVFFPEYDKTHKLVEQTEMHEENGFIFSYAIYEKLI